MGVVMRAVLQCGRCFTARLLTTVSWRRKSVWAYVMAACALNSMRLALLPTKSWPLSAGRKIQKKGDSFTSPCRGFTLHEHWMLPVMMHQLLLLVHCKPKDRVPDSLQLAWMLLR